MAMNFQFQWVVKHELFHLRWVPIGNAFLRACFFQNTLLFSIDCGNVCTLYIHVLNVVRTWRTLWMFFSLLLCVRILYALTSFFTLHSPLFIRSFFGFLLFNWLFSHCYSINYLHYARNHQLLLVRLHWHLFNLIRSCFNLFIHIVKRC